MAPAMLISIVVVFNPLFDVICIVKDVLPSVYTSDTLCIYESFNTKLMKPYLGHFKLSANTFDSLKIGLFHIYIGFMSKRCGGLTTIPRNGDTACAPPVCVFYLPFRGLKPPRSCYFTSRGLGLSRDIPSFASVVWMFLRSNSQRRE